MALLAVITLITLFSVVTILMSGEDPGRQRDPKDNPLLWTTLSRH
jgi:hypothetical protein